MSKDHGQDRDPNTVDWVDLAQAQGDGAAAKAARLEKRALERRRAQAAAEPPPAATLPDKPPARAQVIRLPTWVEAVRGVPIGMLRSALFGVIRRGRRRALEGEILNAVDGITLRYTGWRLDQADLDVWEHAVHLARSEPLGSTVRFTAHAFLRAIGWQTGKYQHDQLAASFRRLTASAVEITIGRHTYMGSLLPFCARENRTGLYALELNQKMLALWEAGWTAINFDIRQALHGQPLAQWLYGYYASHADPYPVKVETLHRLCGSEMALLKHFRAELREALGLVQQAGGIHSWTIDAADLVHVEPVLSTAQQRHLDKHGRKPRTIEHDAGKPD